MALFWSKKSKAEKNYGEEVRKAKTVTDKTVKAKIAKETKPAIIPKIQTTATPSGRFNDTAGAIIRPHITEKSGLLSQSGIYTFQVSRNANKDAVSQAVKTLYKVTPVKIAMINLPARSVFVKGRWGSVSGVRKALVTVKKERR